MEFTASESFSKRVTSIVKSVPCAGIPLPPVYRGETEFHEIAYRLLQCLQFPPSRPAQQPLELCPEFCKRYEHPYKTNGEIQSKPGIKIFPNRILYDSGESWPSARDNAAKLRRR